MLFALLSAAVYALMNIFVRRGQARRPPDGGVLMTVVINAIMLSVLVAGLAVAGLIPPLVLEGLAVFVVAGLLTTYLGRWFQFQSMRHIGAARATSYRITSPIFSTALAMLVLGERLGPGPLFGAAVAVAGVWTFTRANVGAGFATNRTGIGLAFLAAGAFGAGHFLRKFGLLYLPSPYLGAWIGSLVAIVAQVLQLRATGQIREAIATNLRPIEWNLVTAGVLSGIGMLSNYLAVFYAPVSLATALAATEPLFTVVFARWLLGDEKPLSRTALLGMLATIAGVAMILLLA